MIEENAFVPFEVSPLPPGPWLVFAPHADDETFGMGGSILRAKEEGIPVHLVVVTDGALGGERENLVAIRLREVEAAVEFLGIASISCWDVPDRGVAKSENLVAKALDAIDTVQPSAVFFPASYEPHPDHRATTRLVWQALGKRLEASADGAPVPLAYEIGVQSPINTLIDITAVMPRKRQAIDLYHSQNSENDYPDLVAALNRARTFSLPGPVQYAEAFFRFDPQAPRGSLRAENDRYYEQYWR